jgi:hypothetical protein
LLREGQHKGAKSGNVLLQSTTGFAHQLASQLDSLQGSALIYTMHATTPSNTRMLSNKSSIPCQIEQGGLESL